MASSITSTVLQSRASNKAGDALKGAATQGIQTQQGAYDQIRNDYSPYTTSGANANNRLSYLLGLSTSPTNAAGGGLFTGQNLVNSSGGVPTYNATLYAQSPEYKAAWDDLVAQHQSAFGKGYTAGSDSNWINNQLTQRLQGTIDQSNASALTAAQNDPNYGSLTRAFGASDFEAEPGYKFRLDEGQKALERSAAARGNLLSGSAVKAAQSFGQNLASEEYNNAYNRYNTNQNNLYNRLAGISNSGQSAVGNVSNAGLSTANQITGLYGDIGNASAQNYINQGNIWSSGINNLQNKAVSALSGGFGGTGGVSSLSGLLSASGLSGGYDPTTGVVWNTGRQY